MITRREQREDAKRLVGWYTISEIYPHFAAWLLLKLNLPFPPAHLDIDELNQYLFEYMHRPTNS